MSFARKLTFVKSQKGSVQKPESRKMSVMQELQMLSSVTINCQVPKIVMNSGSQLSAEFMFIKYINKLSIIVGDKIKG